MDASEVLDDAFARMPGLVRAAVEGLDVDALTWRPDADANSIGWLVWHLTRVQDDHVADLADGEQIWHTDGWAARFGLAEGTTDIGFGHTPEEVAAVRPDGADVLTEYFDRVTRRTVEFLATIDQTDLDRIVDAAWDPPVTMGVRLVSVVGDCMQHIGQAAYLRGVYERTVRR